jgi:hypothetical protein
MKRKAGNAVRIRYRFIYNGKEYCGVGVNIGDDMRLTVPKRELRAAAVFHAIGDNECSDWISEMFGTTVPTLAQWRKSGVEWDYCEIDD